MAQDFQKFEKYRFHWADYLVFVLMTVLSTGIGIYFGYFRKDKVSTEEAERNDDVQGRQGEREQQQQQKTNFGSSKMNEYLLGSRQMKIFPVAMSLVASYVSGVTILGTVSEIYNFGTQYWLITVSIAFMAIAVAQIYLPVFTKLNVGSSYEYLEMRFSPLIRSFASLIFVIDEIFFLPMILYVPAISLSQVTDINLHIISLAICVVCVFYTLIGGIKAVVHTDAWQIFIMFFSVITVVILGTIYANGFGSIFQSAANGGRLIFANITPSFYERQTLWGVLIGGFSYWTSFNAVNQTMVQRYMSLPSLKNAKKSIAVFTLGCILFISLCCFLGLLVYDLYKECDPLSLGIITHEDQLLPVYVMQTVGKLHGIPGLFIAGVFGAALSSLSVVLNSTSLVILEDIAKGFLKLNLSETSATILVKSSVVVLGVVAVCLVFLLEKLSGILSVAVSVTAIAAGTSFGLFTLGMLVPWSNSKGAFAGAIVGASITGWISLGSQISYALGHITAAKLPVSVRDCPPLDELELQASNSTIDESNVFPLYRLSYHWINPIGVLTTVLVGTIASFLCGATDIKTLNADVISPVIHKYLPQECFLHKRNNAETTDDSAGVSLTQTVSDRRNK